MIIRLDQDTGNTCGCDGKVMQSHLLKVNLDKTQIRYEQLEGAQHIVVPVVMIKQGVVMNEVFVPTQEVFPIAWNGVPVTIKHPQNQKGEYMSANSPDVIDDWAVGTIFNAHMVNGDLKAEAWINVEKANALDPTLIPMITDTSVEMDVSTGFFSTDIEQSGVSNGRKYEVVARNINPDHLALLPGGTGACSWEDGCGIRANERKDPNMADDAEDKVSVSTIAKLLETFGLKPSQEQKTNRRGNDDDYRQVIADLISDDKTPFVPDDEESLRYMSYDTLMSMRKQFLGGGDADGEVKNNANKEADVADDKNGDFVTKAEIGTIIANALKEALPEALKANAAAPALSDEDKAALDAAKNIVANARQGKIDYLKANTTMTDDELKLFSDAQLDVMASRIKAPVADYSGRGLVGNFNEAEDGDEAATDMTVDHVNEFLKANTKAVH